MNILKIGNLKKLVEIGYSPADSRELRLKKSLMTIMVLPYSIAAIIWGIFFMISGDVILGYIPFLYAFASLASFTYFAVTKRYKFFRFLQLLLVLVMPLLVQFSLGGFYKSGCMSIWCCTVPFVALVFYNFKIAVRWLFAAGVVILFAFYMDKYFQLHYLALLQEDSSSVVLIANLLLATLLVFIIQTYFFVGNKKIKFELDKKENLLITSEEVKKQKELLFEANSRLELVMGSLEEVVWGCSLPDYQMQYVSNSVVDIYGLPKEDWFKDSNLWFDMIHPDDKDQVEKDTEVLFAMGSNDLEYRIVTADKSVKWIHSKTRIIKNNEGIPFFMTGIGEDVTDRKNAEEELYRLNNSLEVKVKERTIELSNSEDRLKKSLIKEKELGKLKSSFITVASHQFRTPLAVIQSNIELLEILNTGEQKHAEKYLKITNRVQDAMAKMTSLMDDVLMLGNLTSEQTDYNPEDVNVNKLCNNLVNKFNAIQLDGRTIYFFTKGEIYNLNIDPQLLKYALSSLIDNAFKSSVGKQNPELRIEYNPKEVVFSVRDYGEGISQEAKQHIFEPFFRSKDTAEVQGTGLGLNIAKEYVELNRGKILAESVLGEGTSFELTFER